MIAPYQEDVHENFKLLGSKSPKYCTFLCFLSVCMDEPCRSSQLLTDTDFCMCLSKNLNFYMNLSKTLIFNGTEVTTIMLTMLAQNGLPWSVVD